MSSMLEKMNNSFMFKSSYEDVIVDVPHFVTATPIISPSDPRVRAARILKSIDSLFKRYKNATTEMIDPQGIQALCADLGVDHNKMLRLAWIANAKSLGYFTLLEWRRCLIILGVNSLDNLRKAAVTLDKEVLKESRLTELYEYAFRYSTTKDMQKFLDVEIVCTLLENVLGSKYRPQVNLLIKYLKTQKSYKMISFDQWRCFLKFFRKINFPDFSNHDPADAWPVILDDFVAWLDESKG